jgi:hypothetical protein
MCHPRKNSLVDLLGKKSAKQWAGGSLYPPLLRERERKEAEGNNDPGQGRGTGVVSTVRADASKGFRFLIEEINTIFVPLQQANSWAFEMYQKQGQNELNESALWKRQALFQSALRGGSVQDGDKKLAREAGAHQRSLVFDV